MKAPNIATCILALTSIAAIASSSCNRPASSDVVTLAHYQQVQDGMTYDEVAEIVGHPGSQMMGAEGAADFNVYQWSNSEECAMFVTFGDGLVISKSQAGLK